MLLHWLALSLKYVAVHRGRRNSDGCSFLEMAKDYSCWSLTIKKALAGSPTKQPVASASKVN